MQKLFVTQCPNCFTRFQLSHEQLTAAKGIVRCGECQAIFAATRHLETPPRKLKVIADAELPDSIRVQLDEVTPEPLLLLTIPRRRSAWSRAFWTLALLTTLTAAVAQYAWHERHRLAGEPRLAPLIAPLCQRIDCRLTAPQQVDAIVSHQLLIRDHPQFENALVIDLLLENRAPFEQPFPALKLVFRSRQGHPTAARVFQPADYLGGEFSSDALMPRNKAVQLHLEVLEPASASPTYQLDLIPAER